MRESGDLREGFTVQRMLINQNLPGHAVSSMQAI